MNLENLSTELTYFRAKYKISKKKLADLLKVSINTLQKILKNEYVKDTTKIYVAFKFEELKKEYKKEGE